MIQEIVMLQDFVVGQAERLARLQLRNRILLIGTIVWGVLLLGWMVYCAIRLVMDLRRGMIDSGATVDFTCEKCGSTFSLPAEYLVKHPFIPEKTLHVKAAMIGATVASAKRLRCPGCGRKAWCRQDMQEAYQVARMPLGVALRKNLPRFLIVEFVIFFGGGAFFELVKLILR